MQPAQAGWGWEWGWGGLRLAPASHSPFRDPGHRVLASPGSPPLPEDARGSGLVHAFPSAALSPLTRTRAPSSRSSSPQPQALGAGSALCGMLRDAARAGRLLDRLFHHVARAAAAKNRDVGGGWYPERRCGKGLQMAAPGSLKQSKLFLCPFQPHGNVVDEADCQFKINSLGIE